MWWCCAGYLDIPGCMVGDCVPRRARFNGFTLLESLVVVAIIAVILHIGVPSFRVQVAERCAGAAAHQLYAAVQFSRSAAQHYRGKVLLCGTRDPHVAKPLCDGHCEGGVLAVLSYTTNNRLLLGSAPVERVLVAVRSALAQIVGVLQSDAQSVEYRNATPSVCASEWNWAVVINRLGRPLLMKGWGDCIETVIG